MVDRPSEKDQIRIIIRNLQPALAAHLWASQTAANFQAFFEAGLAVEEGLQAGVWGKSELQKTKRTPYTGNQAPLFREDAIASGSVSEVDEIQMTAPRIRKPSRQFTPFDASLSSVLEELQKQGVIHTLDPTPLPEPLPKSFNHNAFCAYHQMPGHSTDGCHRLRHLVQDLLEKGSIAPSILEANTMTNPLPRHNSGHINHLTLCSTIKPNSIKKPIFDPTVYIVQITQPKPLIVIPLEEEVNMIGADKVEVLNEEEQLCHNLAVWELRAEQAEAKMVFLQTMVDELNHKVAKAESTRVVPHSMVDPSMASLLARLEALEAIVFKLSLRLGDELPEKTQAPFTSSSKPKREFAQFSFPLSHILDKLVKQGLLRPLHPTPLPKVLPRTHNPNAFCEFHQQKGHFTNDCYRLRSEIQDLIDNGTMDPLLQGSGITQIDHLSSTKASNSTTLNPDHPDHPDNQPKRHKGYIPRREEDV